MKEKTEASCEISPDHLPWSSNLPHHCWLSEAGPWIRQDLTQPSSSWVSLPKNCTKTQPRGFGLCASRVWFDLRSTTDSAGMKYFWVVLFCFFPIQPWSQPFPQFSVCSLWGPRGGMFCKLLFFFPSPYTCIIICILAESYLIEHKEQEFAQFTYAEMGGTQKCSHLTFYKSQVTPKQM